MSPEGHPSWVSYGIRVDTGPLTLDLPFSHEGTKRDYHIAFRSPSPHEIPRLRVRPRLLVLEITPLHDLHSSNGHVDPDLYDHLRRTPWYLLVLLRLVSPREVWINHPLHFEVSFSHVFGTYGELLLDVGTIDRLRRLQENLNVYYEAVSPVEAVRGALQIARQTRQDPQMVLADASITRRLYDQYAYVTWAVRRFMLGRGQHPDDYDETVLFLASMLEQLFMRPREGNVTQNLSTRTAALYCMLRPDVPAPLVQQAVAHFYDERSILLHRAYELPTRVINVSVLVEISRVVLAAFIAMSTRGLEKETILMALEKGSLEVLATEVEAFYGGVLTWLVRSELDVVESARSLIESGLPDPLD